MKCDPFALFEGVGNTSLEMIAGIIGILGVKIGLSLLCSILMGLYGYWFGGALAAFTTPVVWFIYFFRGQWTTRKVALEE